MLKIEAEKKVTDLQMKHADSRFPVILLIEKIFLVIMAVFPRLYKI